MNFFDFRSKYNSLKRGLPLKSLLSLHIFLYRIASVLLRWLAYYRQIVPSRWIDNFRVDLTRPVNSSF